MKLLALIDIADGTAIDRIRASLAEELAGSWSLYAKGVVREAYTTERSSRIVFVLETATHEEASQALATLPLIAAGLIRYELVELRPFSNWSLLFR